jgi:uncharacterized membrane protein YhhN
MFTAYLFALLAVGFAGLEVAAAAKKWRRVEFIAKPGAMAFLFLWLYSATGLQGPAAWFGAGLVLAMVGDTLLLWEERGFLPGLGVFLLVQIAYLIGFSRGPAPLSLWSLLLSVVLGVGAARLLRRIVAGIRQSGKSRLALPVLIYGMVMTLMLLSAMLTLSNTQWDAVAAPLAAVGAFLLYMGDLALGWSKFVGPVSGGRPLQIGMYEAGQILLAAGVVMQYGRV